MCNKTILWKLHFQRWQRFSDIWSIYVPGGRIIHYLSTRSEKRLRFKFNLIKADMFFHTERHFEVKCFSKSFMQSNAAVLLTQVNCYCHCF